MLWDSLNQTHQLGPGCLFCSLATGDDHRPGEGKEQVISDQSGHIKSRTDQKECREQRELGSGPLMTVAVGAHLRLKETGGEAAQLARVHAHGCASTS